MNIQGKIKVINEVQVVSDKFKKRELVIVTNDTYPQTIPVQFTQDKCDILDNYKVGQDVDVSINIQGKGYMPKDGGAERYFVNIQGWRIQALEEAADEIPSFINDNDGLDF